MRLNNIKFNTSLGVRKHSEPSMESTQNPLQYFAAGNIGKEKKNNQISKKSHSRNHNINKTMNITPSGANPYGNNIHNNGGHKADSTVNITREGRSFVIKFKKPIVNKRVLNIHKEKRKKEALKNIFDHRTTIEEKKRFHSVRNQSQAPFPNGYNSRIASMLAKYNCLVASENIKKCRYISKDKSTSKSAKEELNHKITKMKILQREYAGLCELRDKKDSRLTLIFP